MERAARPDLPTTRCPHLGPVLCALAAAAALLAGVRAYVDARVPGNLPFYAAYAMSYKINGNVLSAAAFRAPGELPLYGSSELDRWVDNRADAFFARRPSGFAVFPVGRGGVTCLLIAQKLAAVGGAARGKKVVVFLSSSWFMMSALGEEAVGTNLGIPQLSAWIFGGELNPALKSDLARRMRDFSGALRDQPLLAAAVQSLAEPTLLNRVRFALLSPLGRLQNALLARFDHGVILWETVFPQARWRRGYDHAPPLPPMAGGRIDWDRIMARAGVGRPPVNSAGGGDRHGPVLSGSHDESAAFQEPTPEEFADLELLIRVLKDLRMQALFISQPANRTDPGFAAATARNRRLYYERLRAMLGEAGYPLRDFSDREEDPSFFSEGVHPSAKAWLLYDREIDRFYAHAPPGS